MNEATRKRDEEFIASILAKKQAAEHKERNAVWHNAWTNHNKDK